MSHDDALRLRRLHVRRTPGIAEPFALDELSPGVNLVHGPNGSGKTSTAHAIEAALWPAADATRRLGVGAEYALGGARWTVELDAGHVGVQRDGADARPPELPAPEHRDRYRLSLHDLLLAADRGDGFAAEIARQSQGGYDVAAASRELGFTARPSAAAAELRALEEARRALREAQGAQAALHADAERLAGLEERRDAAAEAHERAQLLRAALRHARAAADAAEARERLDAFPPVLLRLRGDEGARLRELAEQLRAADDEERAEAARLEQAERAAADALPDGPPPAGLLPTLQREAAALAGAERAVAEEERRLHDAEAQLARARQDVGALVSDERLAAIDGVAFGELADFAREAERLAAEVAAAETELRQAGDDAPPADLDDVRDGIRVLARWLAEGAPRPALDGGDARRRRMVWLVAAVAVAGWALLAATWHPAAAAGALAAVALAVLGLRRGPAAPDARAARQRDYAALGLPAPEAWTAAAVATLLDELQGRLADGRLAKRRAAWRDDAGRRRRALEEPRRALEARRAALAGRFGVAPDADARTLGWLADRVSRWQDALREREGAAARLATARAQLAQALAACAAWLAPYGDAAPAGASEAAGLVSALEARVRAHADAVERQGEARERLAAVRGRQRRLRDERLALLSAAALADDDEAPAALDALCARHPDCAEARQRLALAEHELAAARAALEAQPGAEPRLLAEAAAALEAERAAADALAAGYGALVSEAATLRDRVETAKRECDVERALADCAAAEAALRAARRRDLHALVGDALVRHVQRATRDQHRPAVFHRARELFAAVTRGRHLLELHDGEPGAAPAFRALDTLTGRGHALDELSSATRVQLLLAVRMAFVETQEHGARPPLFLDETLGTSDDHRAQAIIDAVIALAEGGRQVFYFTAQVDEVARWRAALAARGTAHRVVDLARARGLSAPGDAGAAHASDDAVDGDLLPALAAAPPAPPAPDGRTHAAYGHALGVPRVRVGAERAASAHLWYVVEDLGLLHHLLSLGVSRWGQLETVVAHGGLPALAGHERAHGRACALARLLDVLHERAAVGRGRPVDRAALIGSGAVSRGKLDDVAELAARCGGHAERLVDALYRGEVPGFQRRKTDRLRAHLVERGHLPSTTPLAPAEIRAAVLGAAMPDVAAGTIDAADVDLLLHRVAHGAAEGEPAAPHGEAWDAAISDVGAGTAVVAASTVALD